MYVKFPLVYVLRLIKLNEGNLPEKKLIFN